MPSKDYAYKTVDALQILVTIHYREDDDQPDKRPVAIGFHSGGFTVGSRFLFNPNEIEALLDLGFVVVVADYRLCPHVSLWEGPIQDAKDVLAWTRKSLPSIFEDDTSIQIDPDRVVVFGQSAGGTLALHLGNLPSPPRAIAAFYAAAYFDDELWNQPNPGAEGIPSIDKSFADRVYDEPPASMTAIAPEQFVIPGTMPMPDISKPRDAWLALAIKDGKHLARCVQDGDYQRVDPAKYFSSKFPPVIFLTGTNDTSIDPKFSKRAHMQLSELGVESELVLAEGGQHGYNFGMEGDEYSFKSTVLPAFDFLRSHV